jgi:hypothetical protein
MRGTSFGCWQPSSSWILTRGISSFARNVGLLKQEKCFLQSKGSKRKQERVNEIEVMLVFKYNFGNDVSSLLSYLMLQERLDATSNSRKGTIKQHEYQEARILGGQCTDLYHNLSSGPE